MKIPEPVQRLMARSAVPLTLTAPDGRDHPLIAVNAAFERLTGYPASEIVGKDCRFLQGARSQPSARRTIKSALSEGRGCQTVITNYRKNGEQFDNFLFLFPIVDDAGWSWIVGSQLEIPRHARTGAMLERADALNGDLESLKAAASGRLDVRCDGLSQISMASMAEQRLTHLLG